MTLNPFGGFLFRRTANLANHNNTARVRVSREQLDNIQMGSAIDPVASDTHTGRLADTAAGQLPHRLIGQGAAARDDPDVSTSVDVPRRNPDTAAPHRVLARARRNNTRTV